MGLVVSPWTPGNWADSLGLSRRFFQAACEVPELQDKFNVDEYSDLVTLTKPVIYISIGEIINTHTVSLVADVLPTVC